MFFMFVYVFFMFFVNRHKRIKNDAGEARDPSRKMRLEKCCPVRGLTSTHDGYGASYGRFTAASMLAVMERPGKIRSNFRRGL